MIIMGMTDRVMSKVALPIIVLAAILLVTVLILSTKTQTSQNNGYIRVINCIISIPATERTQGDIESCYVQVEKQVGIKLQRYDTSSFRN